MTARKWRKAGKSNGNGGNNCVEVADLGADRIGVRDSKDPNGPVLEFTRPAWSGFLDTARAGGFDTL